MYTSNAYKYDVRRLEDEIANLESEAAIASEPMRDAILEIITSMTNELALCDERWQIEGVEHDAGPHYGWGFVK